MAVFSPKDAKGDRPDAGLAGHPSRVKGRQFTLRQVMKAVALIAFLLAIVVQAYDSFVLLVSVSSLLVLAACGYGVSRLPYRIRLTIELATACSLLTLSAWMWQPRFYTFQAERCEELAEVCALLAVDTDDVQMADRFRREVAEYNHMARMLRIRGMWAGLLRSFTREHPGRISDREMILAFELHRVMDRRFQLARKMGLIYSGPYW